MAFGGLICPDRSAGTEMSTHPRWLCAWAPCACCGVNTCVRTVPHVSCLFTMTRISHPEDGGPEGGPGPGGSPPARWNTMTRLARRVCNHRGPLPVSSLRGRAAPTCTGLPVLQTVPTWPDGWTRTPLHRLLCGSPGTSTHTCVLGDGNGIPGSNYGPRKAPCRRRLPALRTSCAPTPRTVHAEGLCTRGVSVLTTSVLNWHVGQLADDAPNIGSLNSTPASPRPTGPSASGDGHYRASARPRSRPRTAPDSGGHFPVKERGVL